jgi:hypothetical protein
VAVTKISLAYKLFLFTDIALDERLIVIINYALFILLFYYYSKMKARLTLDSPELEMRSSGKATKCPRDTTYEVAEVAEVAEAGEKKWSR